MTNGPAPPPAPGALGRHRSRRAVVVAVVVATTTTLPVILVGAEAVQIRHSLRFGLADLGLLAAGYYLAAATFSVPFGRMVDRLGELRILRMATLASGALVLAVALAARSWSMLLVLMVLCGISSAAAQPAANSYLSHAIPPGRQGTAFGIKQSSVPLATLVGGISVPLVAIPFGFRWAFIGTACVALLAWAATWWAPRPDYRANGLSSPPPSRPGALPLVVLGIGLGLGLAAANSMSAFLASSAVAAGMGKGSAGLVVAIGGASGVAARLVSGAVADRRGERHFVAVAKMLAIGVLGYGALAIGAGSGTAWLFLPAALVAYAAGWGWNGVFNFAVVRTHSLVPGWASGVTQTGGRIGGMVGPLVFGLLASRLGYDVGWLFAMSLAVAAALVMLIGRGLLRRTDWRDRATVPPGRILPQPPSSGR